MPLISLVEMGKLSDTERKYIFREIERDDAFYRSNLAFSQYRNCLK